jgi:hypothetical protein
MARKNAVVSGKKIVAFAVVFTADPALAAT